MPTKSCVYYKDKLTEVIPRGYIALVVGMVCAHDQGDKLIWVIVVQVHSIII